jgi:hypothetical protein
MARLASRLVVGISEKQFHLGKPGISAQLVNKEKKELEMNSFGGR